MAQVAELYLDVKKTGHYTNDIINLRVGDNTDQILVHVLLNGEPHQKVENATFFAEKPDETIVANDPANVVDPSTISYPISEQLTAAAGNVTKAYFIINTTSSTDSFRINILPSVNPKGDSLDYIPGLKILQDKLNVKINAMKEQINNIDVSDEVKKVMNDALDKAKTDYMATFSQAIAELNATVSALKSKEATATESGNNLDAAIDSMNKKIADVNSFLATTQQQIIDANSKFTSDQEASINDLTKKLIDEINAIQSSADDLDTRVAGIKIAVDALDIPKINADTATALKNSKDAKDAVANKIDGATLNGSDVAVKDGKLDINVADPDMSEYATNNSVDTKLGDYSKSADIAKDYAKKGDVPANALTIWKGSADDYAALTEKADNTEYNVVDDTGIKNIYVGKSEIYKRGIPEGTVIYEDDNYWDETTQNFKVPLKYGSGNRSRLKNGFSFVDIKNGIALGINDSLFTNNTSYPRIMYHNNLNYDGISQPIAGDTKSSGIVFIHLDWNNILAMNSVNGGYPDCDIGEHQTKDSGTGCWLYKKDGSTDVNAKWSGNNWFQPKMMFYNKYNSFTFNLQNTTTIIPSGSTQKVSIHPYPVLNKIIAY